MVEKKMAPGKTNVPYDLRERTFVFSVRVLKWARTLPHDMGTQIAVRQLLEAATSVGANIEEADGTDTQKDRVYKWVLSRKEAREARYWIRVICAQGQIRPRAALSNKKVQNLSISSAL